MQLRGVRNFVPVIGTSDGTGVKLNRTIGGSVLDSLDPFLLLDEFGFEDGDDYIGGFSDHPHRVIETVTYMLDGLLRRENGTGAGGTLTPGGDGKVGSRPHRPLRSALHRRQARDR